LERKALYIAEAINCELFLHKRINFPFPRIEVSICNNTVEVEKKVVEYPSGLGNYVEVRVKSDPHIVEYSSDLFQKTVFETVRQGIEYTSAYFKTDMMQLRQIVEIVRSRDKVFRYQLKRFSQTDAISGIHLYVFYEMTQQTAQIDVDIMVDGELKENIVVVTSKPMLLPYFFPAHRTALDKNQLHFYDKDGEIIATIRIQQ
jgi:hypothetical protein